MDRISFTIFIPDGKKFHLTPDWIVFGLWFISIGFFWQFDMYFPGHDEFRKTSAICVFLITMYYLVTSFFKYKPLNGTLSGKIIFEKNSVIVNDNVFELKDMKKIDFMFGDYFEERSSSGRNFNPKIYQGVSNSVSITDKTNQTQTIYFQMMGKHSYMSLYDFINEAVRLGVMSYLRAEDLIGDENVVKPG